jgi:hypothetical protein
LLKQQTLPFAFAMAQVDRRRWGEIARGRNLRAGECFGGNVLECARRGDADSRRALVAEVKARTAAVSVPEALIDLDCGATLRTEGRARRCEDSVRSPIAVPACLRNRSVDWKPALQSRQVRGPVFCATRRQNYSHRSASRINDASAKPRCSHERLYLRRFARRSPESVMSIQSAVAPRCGE